MSVEFQAYLQKRKQVWIMTNIMNIYSPTLIFLVIFFKLPARQLKEEGNFTWIVKGFSSSF